MYVIIDWCNNICFDGIRFNTPDDAIEYLYSQIPDTCDIDGSTLDDFYISYIGGSL